MKSNLPLLFCFVVACTALQAQDESVSQESVRVGVADGQVQGQLFAMLGDQKAPLVGKIALTDATGKAVAVVQSDDEGKFAFTDINPGKYKAIGIAGDYAGDTDIEVLSVAVEETSVDGNKEGVYTAIPLPVAPATSTAIFNAYPSLPTNAYSIAPSMGVNNVGGGGVSYSGCGCGCGSGSSFGRGAAGGFNFRRLALLGAAVAIPVALSGGDDDEATPAAP